MAMLRKIQCDVNGCPEELLVEGEVKGFPNWGAVQGKIDDGTGEVRAFLCPKHLNKITDFINKGEGHDMG